MSAVELCLSWIQVLNEQGNKGPLKYLEGIEIEEVTLGMVPPRLHVCHARFSPSHNYLQLETEVDVYSSGFQLVVTIFTSRPGYFA